MGLTAGVNTYAYGNGAPIGSIDPFGLQTVPFPAPGPFIFPPVVIPGTPENKAWTKAATQALESIEDAVKGVVQAIHDACTNDNHCEALQRIDTDTCNAITKRRGARAGAACHASASERYAACLRGRPLPPLNTWNN